MNQKSFDYIRSDYRTSEPYTTKDGSVIRELIHPLRHGNHQQSLAEAMIAAGMTTHLHKHLASEEIYHVTAGSRIMTIGKDRFNVSPGDSVLIPPGTPHAIQNSSNHTLTLLCCCAPAYSHDDTVLLAP